MPELIWAMAFSAAGGWRAVTTDHSGDNLPSEYGPWHKLRIVSVDTPEGQADLASSGYHITQRTSDA